MKFRVLFFLAALTVLFPLPAWAQDGFAREATGGAGGREVTVRTAEEFKALAAAPEPLRIRVEGGLDIGTVSVGSDKTIQGADSGATLRGNLLIGGGARNVIVRNVTFSNPMNKKGKGGGDGVTVRGAKTVWIDHCSFLDCGDGCIDITEGGDLVTVSWCKFSYTKQPKHRFVMLAMGREKKKHKHKPQVTLHHNWFAENCDQRMPAIRKARVHLFNNYFSCEGNTYCTNVRAEGELLSEGNFYDHVRNPSYVEDGGKIRSSKNIYENCTGKIEKRDDKVFDPPYDWKMRPAAKVPEIVRAGAGAR